MRSASGVAAVVLAAAALSGLCAAASARAASAPLCTPSSFGESASLAGGAVTVSPSPGSRDASFKTQLSFLGPAAGELQDISVRGSRSGAHSGRLEAYSQGDGASFVPKEPFDQGETVTVHAVLVSGAASTPFSWSFVVADVDEVSRSLETPPPPPPPVKRSEVQHFLSRPDLQPPTVTVTHDAAGRGAEDIFIAPYAGPGQYGPMIMSPQGSLLWFRTLAPGARAADLRVQELEGKPVLTWWQDPVAWAGHSGSGLVIANSSYQDIDVVRAGNGYEPDLHSFVIEPDGVAFTTIYDAIRCDLSAEHGPAEGAIADTVAQEIDLRTGLVRYEWHSLDHVPLSDSYQPIYPNGTPHSPWDYFHINRIQPQPSGNLLINSRNTWATYLIAGQTGQVIWRLGGKQSSFAMGSGAAGAWQHDAEIQSNGLLTFFDNGATPKVHSQSRAVILRLNEQLKTASLLQSFVHPGSALVAPSQGNMQSLPDGNWFIGWGQEPYFSEFTAAGQELFDAHLPATYQSFTDLRFPWTGTPTQPPAIAAVAQSHGALAVYASWNGATSVVSWQLLAGAGPHALAPAASAPRTGFESVIRLAHSQPYVAVQAIGSGGQVLGQSAAVRAPS